MYNFHEDLKILGAISTKNLFSWTEELLNTFAYNHGSVEVLTGATISYEDAPLKPRFFILLFKTLRSRSHLNSSLSKAFSSSESESKMVWSQLPAVALAKVISYLSLRDQLNVRKVCKYWRLVNDSSVPRRELILFLKIHPTPVYWHHDKRECDPSNILWVNFRLLKSKFFWSYFRKIRRLMVAFRKGTYCKHFTEPIQASFTDLLHLQFTSIGNELSYWDREIPQTEFRLKNLRTLYSFVNDVPVDLNCPNLTELFICCNLTIESTNEQTKKYLQNLRLLRVYRLAYPPGFEFTNLQVLHLQNLPISLVDFPKLKELHCLILFGQNEQNDEVLFEELLQQKKQLKREDLRIFCQGFDMEGRNFRDVFESHLRQIDRHFVYSDFNAEVLRLAKKSPSSCNFSLDSKDLDLYESTDDELAVIREGELPDCLFRSITHLKIWKLSKISPTFFEISHKFPYIHSISIYYELSQALLDQLPDVLPRLAFFTYEPKPFKNYRVSFEFVARFKSLNFFSACNFIISIDEFQLILQNCEALGKAIFFQHPEKREYECLWVEPTGKPERRIYKLNWRKVNLDRRTCEDYKKASFNHEELFEYLKTSKWIPC